MDFNLEKDFAIFDKILSLRPEISPDGLKDDLQKFFLPYLEKLITIKKNKNSNQGLIVGVSAIQGAGKTTQGEIVETLLAHFNYTSVSRSIDDDYITHLELCRLRDIDARFIRRGVTHDIPLAILGLRDLREMGEEPVLVSGYDKGANTGDGERFRFINPIAGLVQKLKVIEEELIVDQTKQILPVLKLTDAVYENRELILPTRMGSDIPIIEPLLSKELVDFLQPLVGQEISVSSNGEKIVFTGQTSTCLLDQGLPNGWRLVTKKPDFIFYDGWMLGARQIQDESVFDADLPALESPKAKQFAKDINKRLFDYEPLWQMIEFMNVLLVPNYQISIKWRDQAEEVLRAKGEGMTHQQIVDFVHYFWRSVHPAIHIKRLAEDETRTQQVVVINDDHSISEVLRVYKG